MTYEEHTRRPCLRFHSRSARQRDVRMRCHRLMTLMRRKRRQYLMQPGDQILGPLSPGRGNNAARHPVTLRGLLAFPYAHPAPGAVPAVKFLRQLFAPAHCREPTILRLALANGLGTAQARRACVRDEKGQDLNIE